MNFKIRRATEKDIQDLFKIERLCQVSPWTFEVFQACFRAEYLTWVMEHEFDLQESAGIQKEMIAFIMISVALDEVHILNVAVKPEFRRQGHGISLMQTVHEYARRQAARSIFLEVRKSNVAASALYKTLGYQKIGERKNYYQTVSGFEDAWVLALLL